MVKSTRREFLKVGLIASVLGGTAKLVGADYLPKLYPTPGETEGPFYPVTPQKDRDFDLARVEGKEGAAQGEVIMIEGRVLDTNGNAVGEASVDLWQANAAGRYRHPHDANQAPLDPNFQGWAIVPSGTDGRFRFKTVLPGTYPASRNWTRPPHIHFKITKPGFVSLITQMYFPGQPLNEVDLLPKRKGEGERKLMIASRVGGSPVTYRYNLVLQRA